VGAQESPPHTPPYPAKAGSATEGAYKTCLPCKGEVRRGQKSPPHTPPSPEGLKYKIIRDKKAT